MRFFLRRVVHTSFHIQWDIRNSKVMSLCFLSGVDFVTSRCVSGSKEGTKILSPAQMCVQNAERDVKYQKWCWGRGGAQPSELHPSLAWSSASGLTIFDMLILVQVHHHFDQSFSYICQALILWNTNAVFGKFKFNVSNFMVEGLHKISWLRFKHVYFFCASSPFR